MWYERKEIALPLERFVSYLIKNHEVLRFTTLDILRLNYALEAIRTLPKFIDIPEIQITISDTIVLTFNKSEIAATTSGGIYSDGVGYDSNSGDYFVLNKRNIEDYDYTLNSVENAIEEFMGWIDLSEPGVKISGAEKHWFPVVHTSVFLVVDEEDSLEAQAELAIENAEELKKTFLDKFASASENPKYVILWCLLRYVKLWQVREFIYTVARPKMKPDKKLIDCLLDYVDLELLKTKPIAWQDIWIYGYIKFKLKSNVSQSKMLSRYVREVMKVSGENYVQGL